MSPIVRGRPIPQIESSGRTKKSFDILLYTEELSRNCFRILDELQVLREYLGTIQPQTVAINLWLPANFDRVHAFLSAAAIATSRINPAMPSPGIAQILGAQAPARMGEAAATALSCDADLIITEDSDWYPFYEEFQKLGVLVGSPHVILPQTEVFVRGHDMPWAFNSPMFDAPWGPFYFFGEDKTLTPGQAFLDKCNRKGIDAEVQEIGRSLIYNRIPNILFTRDRLLFYEMQQAAAKRAKWTRQKFQFEVGYHLNFYYVLLYGAFDHLAVMLNGVLGLGLAVRDVTAKNNAFLTELQKKAPELHAMFTDAKTVEFIERVGSLRHATAHRTQIMPGPIYEKPDHEPTATELDKEIAEKGLDRDLQFFPAGPVREAFRENLRFRLKMEKHKVLLEDAVYIEGKNFQGFINPLIDTEWNSSRFYAFYSQVLNAAAKRI